MPTYAVLGATGATGTAIVRSLLTNPPKDLTLNIFVRSKFKLSEAFPDLENTTAFKVNITEATPDNSAAMQKCLKDVDVVMAVIGTNVSSPDITVSHDTAVAVISALEFHRENLGQAYKTPTVIQLRSTSLNPTLKAYLPYVAQYSATFCFHYIYRDLSRACDLFASTATEKPGLLEWIYIDPPALHDADGTTPTGFELVLDAKMRPDLAYADLGAAFCEVAVRKGEFARKAVGVSATGAVNLTLGTLFGYVVAGVKSRVWG